MTVVFCYDPGSDKCTQNSLLRLMDNRAQFHNQTFFVLVIQAYSGDSCAMNLGWGENEQIGIIQQEVVDLLGTVINTVKK